MIALVSKNLSKESQAQLEKYVDEIFIIDNYEFISDSVGLHPDIHFFYIDGILFYNPIFEKLVEKIKLKYSILAQSCSYISKSPYPFDAGYNVLVNQKLAFHNFQYTDPILLKYLKKTKRQLIPVNQGHANCSSVLVDNLLISSDRGMIKSTTSAGLDTLYIDNSQIKLKDYKNGFIGGSVGQWEDKIFINGNVKFYDWGKTFINKCHDFGKNCVFLQEDYLEDVGSILFVGSDPKNPV